MHAVELGEKNAKQKAGETNEQNARTKLNW